MSLFGGLNRHGVNLHGSPELTPEEVNTREAVEYDYQPGTDVPVYVSQIARQSLVPTRPARRQIVFFLQPTSQDGDWGDWWGAAGGFIQGKEIFPNKRDMPQGMFTLQDQRRNIAVPPTESYGDDVGELDGYSQYGLEDY